MSDDDVWEPGEAGIAYQGDELGRLDYDSGPSLYSVMNPGAVIVAGIAMLKEAPAIGLVGGGMFWVLAMIPGILGAFIDVGTEFAALAGTLPPEVTDLIGSLGSMVVNLFFAPLQWMAWVGTAYATAWYVHTDDADVSKIVTGRVLVRGIGFGIVSTLLAIVGSAVFFLPVGGVVYALISYADQFEGALLFLLLSLPVFLALWAFFALKLWMGWLFAALDDAGPVEALTDSWFVTDLPAMGMLLVTFMLMGTLNFVMACMCFFPALFVQAVYIPGLAVCWMRFSRGDAAGELPFFQRNDLPIL